MTDFFERINYRRLALYLAILALSALIVDALYSPSAPSWWLVNTSNPDNRDIINAVFDDRVMPDGATLPTPLEGGE